LIDQKENSIVRELRVQAMPVFVLISNEGKILFNGEPSDDELWKALNKIDSQIARPTMTNSSE
jgi:TATA-box binding protein (TBP) (component of TFIID and TFIIIB)